MRSSTSLQRCRREGDRVRLSSLIPVTKWSNTPLPWRRLAGKPDQHHLRAGEACRRNSETGPIGSLLTCSWTAIHCRTLIRADIPALHATIQSQEATLPQAGGTRSASCLWSAGDDPGRRQRLGARWPAPPSAAANQPRNPMPVWATRMSEVGVQRLGVVLQFIVVRSAIILIAGAPRPRRPGGEAIHSSSARRAGCHLIR